MSHYPSFQDLQDCRPSDGVLFTSRRALRSSITYIALFLLTSGLVFFTYYQVGHWTLSDTGFGRYVSVKWLAIIPFYFLFELVRRQVDDLYEFEAHHLTCKGGRVSLSYTVPSVKYIDIRAIRVRQDIFGRIFNYGTLELATAAQEETEIFLECIVGPKELALLVDDLRQVSMNIYYEELRLKSTEDNSVRGQRRVVHSRPPASRVVG
jgi:membrane protein YdbS with pleckstrin-like domain